MVGSMFMAMVGAELLYDHVCEKLREFFNCQEPLPDIERLHPAELVGSFARYKWFYPPATQYTSCSDPLRIEIYFGNLMAGPFWQPFIWNIRAGKMGLVKSFNSKHYITLNSNLQWHLFNQQNYSFWLLKVLCAGGVVYVSPWNYDQILMIFTQTQSFSWWCHGHLANGTLSVVLLRPIIRSRPIGREQRRLFSSPLSSDQKILGKSIFFSAKKSILIRPIRGEQKIEQNISTK